MGVETSPHVGLQGVDLTSAGFFFDLEKAFALTERLNDKFPGLGMRIELYTTLDRTPFAQLTSTAQRLGIHLPLPEGVTAQKVWEWQNEYTLAKVERVHLPFEFDTLGLIRAFKYVSFIRQLGYIVYIGAAKNMQGVKLAQELGVGINAHASVLRRLAQAGVLDKIKNSVPYVVAEPDDPNKSKHFPELAELAVPSKVAELVEKYGLGGILLNVDHDMPEGVTYKEELKKEAVREHTVAMHIAGRNHAPIMTDDKEFTHFLELVAQTSFDHPVRAALDYNPFTLRNLSPQELFELFEKTVRWIMQTQGKNL